MIADCFDCDVKECPQRGHDVAPMSLCPKRSPEDKAQHRANTLKYILFGMQPTILARKTKRKGKRVEFSVPIGDAIATITMPLHVYQYLYPRK